jgi:hypothetical protein
MGKSWRSGRCNRWWFSAGCPAFGCRSWGFSLFRRGAVPWLGRPVVKSRKSARICRNLNRFLFFHDAHGFIEIGFVRCLSQKNWVPV